MAQEARRKHMNRLFKWLWLLSVILLIGQSLTGYGELPDRMASHFNAAGEPDGYSSKQEFFLLWYFLIVIVNIWVPLAPMIVRKLPSLLSVPNKNYWLADESRRERLIGILTDVLSAILFLTNVILMLAFKYTADVNLGAPPPFSLSWIIVLAVFGLLIGIIYPIYALRIGRKDIDG